MIVGAGGHGKVVADVALDNKLAVLGFLDDNTQTAPLPGYAVLGSKVDPIVKTTNRSK